MSRIVLGNPGKPLVRCRNTNGTASTFTAPVATATKPSGEGVVNLEKVPPTWLKVVPIGAGNNNGTFDLRVIGWALVSSLWVPTVLCQFTATLSLFVGLSGNADAADTDRFADTLSAPATNLGAADVDCHKYSPANDTPGCYLIDGCGHGLFEVQVAINGANVTNGNALAGPA